MPVTPEFRDYVLEQLGRVVPVSGRAMFGGVGIYSEGVFFALIADDQVYCKVDDVNRVEYESAGMRRFQPFGEGSKPMGYYELPGEVLEEPERLRPWIEGALGAARRRGRGSAKRRRSL